MSFRTHKHINNRFEYIAAVFFSDSLHTAHVYIISGLGIPRDNNVVNFYEISRFEIHIYYTTTKNSIYVTKVCI